LLLLDLALEDEEEVCILGSDFDCLTEAAAVGLLAKGRCVAGGVADRVVEVIEVVEVQ